MAILLLDFGLIRGAECAANEEHLANFLAKEEYPLKAIYYYQ